MSNYTTADVQIAYVAFFGRPAEPAGLDFWVSVSNSVTKEQMYADFAMQPEYRAYYAAYIDAGTGQITDAIGMLNEVYNNLFHRDIEAGGVSFWAPLLANGTVTIDDVVLDVLAGAQNADLVAVQSKLAAANAFTTEARATDYMGYAGAEAADDAHNWLAEIYDTATKNSHVDATALHASVVECIAPDSTTPVDQTFILTTGQDVLTGGAGNDTFRSTQATLQIGDDLDGGEGSDKLTVSIAGSGISLDGFATTSVETIEVKSISTSASTLDLSDVVGLTTLVSRETDGASLTFRDIQSVNDVNISIIDTDETHNFGYDLNAYTSGVDNVDLRLEEVRDAEINFFNTNGSTALGVEKISIDSENILDPSIGRNLVSDLNVGDYLNTVMIKGNADFEVEAPLDRFISLVDARELQAKLTLDMSEEDSSVKQVTFMGAQDDTYITFGSAGNKKSITTYGGDDTIYAGEGNNTITSGAGDDYITSGAGNDLIQSGTGNDTIYAGEGNNTITSGAGDDYITSGAGNDLIQSGTGNDTIYAGEGNNVVDAGENDDFISTGAGSDNVNAGEGDDTLYDLGGNNVIDMGAGADVVKIGTIGRPGCVVDGMGNNLIDLGTGNDTLWMDAKELEVADTITGNSGVDTMVLCNTTGRADYGYVMASETQRTTSIEVFDLHNSGIYLKLTDNLIESAQDKSIKVVTESATGTQVVDITSITTPIYNFELQGNETKDIVVADDMTVNSMSTMRFDHDATPEGNSNDSTADTLIVTDAANISATDTLNITGLERIILGDDMLVDDFPLEIDGTGKIWNVDITDALIEQTTNNSTLIIKVGTNVPAGSKLYLNTVGDISSDTSVQVLRNSNVTVYLNGALISADGMALNYVGDGALYIDTPLEFTETADSLVGTSGDDTFYASSPDQLDLSDFADGLGHEKGDTLVLGAGLYAGTSAWLQMNAAKLDNIEILEFSEDVSYGVSFADAYQDGFYEFSKYYLTPGADTVTNALSNHMFTMYGGADELTTASNAQNVTIDGGDDYDVVNMLSSVENGGASINIIDVERVNGGAGNDTVNILDANSVPVLAYMGSGNDVVNGSTHGDIVTVYGEGGNDSVYGYNGNDNITATSVEYISGGNGDDVIVASGNSGNDVVYGGADNDTITVTNFESVYGDSGADTITITSSSSVPVTITGGAGDDTIHLSGVSANGGSGIVETVVFGSESAHPGAGTNITVSSGFDTIDNFAAGAHSGAQDILDFTSLVSNGVAGNTATVEYGSLAGGLNLNNLGTNAQIAVVWGVDHQLTHLDFAAADGLDVLDHAGLITLNSDGEAIIAYSSSVDGDNVDHVNLAYVCDTDTGAGETWVVVEIGTVTFDELTGLNSGTLNSPNFLVG
jgi:Ca2+-binding RTX toxin-like protein